MMVHGTVIALLLIIMTNWEGYDLKCSIGIMLTWAHSVQKNRERAPKDGQ